MGSTKGQSLPDGSEVWCKMIRSSVNGCDTEESVWFEGIDDGPGNYLTDEDWLTPEEARKELCSDEIKFGDMVLGRDNDIEDGNEYPCSPVVYLGKIGNQHYTLGFEEILGNTDLYSMLNWDEVKKAPNKIELTIEEIEEKLGYDKGSLIVK